MSAEEALKEMGLALPEMAKPLASYVPWVRTGNLVFVSGQVCLAGGELKFKGKIGRDLTPEEGYEAAKLCCLNCLAAVRAAVGTLDRVKRVVKVVGFVNSAPGFTDHPKVVNGASDLLAEVFGEAGRHARSAVGVFELPANAAVEVEMVVEV